MANFAFKIHWDMLYVVYSGQRWLKHLLGESGFVIRCSTRSVYVTSRSQLRERDHLVVSAKRLGQSSHCVSGCRYFISLSRTTPLTPLRSCWRRTRCLVSSRDAVHTRARSIFRPSLWLRPCQQDYITIYIARTVVHPSNCRGTTNTSEPELSGDSTCIVQHTLCCTTLGSLSCTSALGDELVAGRLLSRARYDKSDIALRSTGVVASRCQLRRSGLDVLSKASASGERLRLVLT
jgi:hypothetical protein